MDERLERLRRCFQPRQWFFSDEELGSLFEDGEVLFMWVYKEVSDPSGNKTYCVGFYTPGGEWTPESSYATKEYAAQRVNYLNGGRGE